MQAFELQIIAGFFSILNKFVISCLIFPFHTWKWRLKFTTCYIIDNLISKYHTRAFCCDSFDC
jgi:hypothetical protein